MRGHVIDAGYSTSVFSRTKAKADDLVAKGARWAASPREVAAASDVVFSIVGYPDDVVWTLRVKVGEKRYEPRTPAMVAGLTDHIWTIQEWATYPARKRIRDN